MTTVQAIRNITYEFTQIRMNFFQVLPKITNFVQMYKIHIPIRTRNQNKRKNSYAKFQKFVHEF